MYLDKFRKLKNRFKLIIKILFNRISKLMKLNSPMQRMDKILVLPSRSVRKFLLTGHCSHMFSAITVQLNLILVRRKSHTFQYLKTLLLSKMSP